MVAHTYQSSRVWRGKHYWPGEAVSHRSSRVSQIARNIGRTKLNRGGSFASELARITVRAYHGADIIDPRRRFRIVARVYHGHALPFTVISFVRNSIFI